MADIPAQKMIITDGLTRHFGEVRAVENLSVAIPAGEVFGLLGPNGAGKTTTIRLLCGLIGATAGTAQVAGFELGQQDMDIRRRVGILTEAPGLYDQLSAERNLTFYATLYEVNDIPGQVERYLRMLGLWDRRQDSVGTFSKGMRQKLAIARALLHEPQILFLDEPTSGLDPQAARLVREFISELKRAGRTLIICTHNLDEADRLCDRVAVFRSHLLALDTPAALRRQLFGRQVVFHLTGKADAYTQAAAQFDFVQEVEALDEKLIVTLDDPDTYNPAIVRLLVEDGAEVRFIGELRRSLEDVYMRLVQDSPKEGQP